MAARLQQGLSEALPGCQEARREACQAPRRPVWRPAKLPGGRQELSGGLSGGLVGCQEACLEGCCACQEGCQAVRRPVGRATRSSGGLSACLLQIFEFSLFF